MITLPPAIGAPSRVIGFIWKYLASASAASPKPISIGVSETIWQLSTRPVVRTSHSIVTWPLMDSVEATVG
jgi:hypothetical protein